jgi:hypothetical protein
MGNRMFQYGLGCILKSIRNCDIYHEGLPNFGVIPNSKQFPTSSLRTSTFGQNYVDMDALKGTDRDIIVDSYVQKAEYYVEFKDILRNAFNWHPQDTINKNKLVVHIRETDYTQINSFLGYEVYKKIIENSGFTNIVIVTDNSSCETVQRLISEGCTLNSPGYVDTFTPICDDRGMFDFNTLMYSENILISQSSFSWWSAFLGDHKTIIFPFTTKPSLWKINPGLDDIDLFYQSSSTLKNIV